MEKKAMISSVLTNKEKQQNYLQLMALYQECLEKGFLAEAEVIVYAYLEDRLRSLLYYMGAIRTWNGNWLTDEVAEIVGQVNKLDDISTKYQIVSKLAKKTSNRNIQYLKNLGEKLSDEDKVILKNIEQVLSEWCRFRNEVIHALFNKDLDDLNRRFREHVECGFQHGRKLDNIVKHLKKYKR